MESQNEHIQDKVRARAAVATDSGEGNTESGHQIAKLIAALTKVGQGSSPASAQSNRREKGCMEGDELTGVLLAIPAPTTAGPVLDRLTPDHSTPTGHGMGTTISRNQGQKSQGTNARCEGATNWRDPNSPQCFRCQGLGHMAREFPSSSHSFKPV